MMGNTKQSVTEKMIMPFRFAACPLSLKCIIVLNLNKRDFVSLASTTLHIIKNPSHRNDYSLFILNSQDYRATIAQKLSPRTMFYARPVSHGLLEISSALAINQ